MVVFACPCNAEILSQHWRFNVVYVACEIIVFKRKHTNKCESQQYFFRSHEQGKSLIFRRSWHHALGDVLWSSVHRAIWFYGSTRAFVIGFDLRIVSSNQKFVNLLRLSFQVSRSKLRCWKLWEVNLVKIPRSLQPLTSREIVFWLLKANPSRSRVLGRSR